MISNLVGSKTIVFALVMCLLALLLFIVVAIAEAAFGVEVPYFSDILDFFKVTFLGVSAKNAVDNNLAPTAAALKSGTTDAPPISKWNDPATTPTDGPSIPYGGI